jgi:hypothetical protein
VKGSKEQRISTSDKTSSLDCSVRAHNLVRLGQEDVQLSQAGKEHEVELPVQLARAQAQRGPKVWMSHVSEMTMLVLSAKAQEIMTSDKME